jgi:hypothetical protein
VTSDSTLGGALDYILGLQTLGATSYYISANPTTNLSSAPYSFAVSTAVGGGIGTPTGNVWVSDSFTPFTTNMSGMGTPVPGCTPTLTTGCTPMYQVPLISGVGTFYPVLPSTPPANVNLKGFLAGAAPGLHILTVYYTATPTTAGTSGDSNFLTSSTASAPVALVVSSPASSSTWPAVTGDFLVQAEAIVSGTLTTAPVQIAPGTIPGGGNTGGQSASFPEQAQIYVTPYLNFAGTIYLGCLPQSPAYVTCTITPPTVTGATTGAAVTTTVNISTPPNLPVGFNFGTSVAFLPLGLFALCVRRRRKLSNALWILLAIAFVSVGMVGCADNSVHFYTPVPAGPQYVTIYACTVQASCTGTLANPITGTGAPGSTVATAGLIRSYPLLINIQ